MKKGLIYFGLFLLSILSSFAICDITVNPGDNITLALETAPTGSDVCINFGSYVSNQSINLTQGNLTIHGNGTCSFPIITLNTSEGFGIHFQSSNITLHDLEITGTSSVDLIASTTGEGHFNNISIRNNRIHQTVFTDECIELKECTDCIIENNEIFNCGGDGATIAANSTNGTTRNNEIRTVGLNTAVHGENGAIHIYGDNGLIVQCNFIHDAHNRGGIAFSGDAAGQSGIIIRNNLVVNNPLNFSTAAGGSLFWRGSGETFGLTIINNTFANNGKPGNNTVNGTRNEDPADANFTIGPKNIFYNHTGFGMQSSGPNITSTDNVIFANVLGTFSGSIIDNASIFGDPLFDADFNVTNSSLVGYGWNRTSCGTIGPICPPIMSASINKTDTPDPVLSGASLFYTITITNNGTMPIFNLTLFDIYPPNVSFATSSPPPISGNDTFSLGNLSVGQVTTVNITVTVSSSMTAGILNNTAVLNFSSQNGTNMTLNTSTLTTVISPPSTTGGGGSGGYQAAASCGNCTNEEWQCCGINPYQKQKYCEQPQNHPTACDRILKKPKLPEQQQSQPQPVKNTRETTNQPIARSQQQTYQPLEQVIVPQQTNKETTSRWPLYGIAIILAVVLIAFILTGKKL